MAYSAFRPESSRPPVISSALANRAAAA
jgi:hypothetical protein